MSRLRRIAIVVAIAAAALWVHLYEFSGQPLYDSALFLTVGKLMQRGLLLYRDLWDTKPPGIYLYQRAVFALLPAEVWSLRMTDYLLYVAGGVLFYSLCALAARWPLALAATALWLHVAHHPSFNVAGFYTEEYSSIAAIAAVAAAARYWRGGALGWAAASGVAAATAILFKHPGAAAVLPAALLLTAQGNGLRRDEHQTASLNAQRSTLNPPRRGPAHALALFALGLALPLSTVVAYFWWHGALAAFLDCQVFHLIARHGATGPGGLEVGARLTELARHTAEQLGGQPLLLVPVAAGIAVGVLRPNRLRVAALLWLAADLALIAAQRFYYPHYFIQLFPSAILVGVIGAAAVLESRRRDPVLLSLARLALCIAAVAVALRPVEGAVLRRQRTVAYNWWALRHDRNAWLRVPGGAFEAELGRYLAERTGRDDRVFVFASGSGVAAYAIADRLPASRYLFNDQVMASPERQVEQLDELARTRPAYVAVVVAKPREFYFTPWLKESYRLETVYQLYNDRAELWVRKES